MAAAVLETSGLCQSGRMRLHREPVGSSKGDARGLNRCPSWAEMPDVGRRPSSPRRRWLRSGTEGRSTEGRARPAPWEGLVGHERAGGVPQVICPSPPTFTTGGAPLSSQPHTLLLPESCFLHPGRGNAWCCPLALPTPHEQEAALIPGGWEAHATSVLREADCARLLCVTRGR